MDERGYGIWAAIDGVVFFVNNIPQVVVGAGGVVYTESRMVYIASYRRHPSTPEIDKKENSYLHSRLSDSVWN